MHWTDRRRRFRAILGGNRCVHPGSVFDPISARIAEDLGFEVGMFAGSTASLTVLGAPDLIVLTLSEFARPGLSHQPRRQPAADGRRRPWLWQCAQRQAHGRGAGNGGRRRPEPRGHRPADAVRHGQAAADVDRRGRRQDEGGAGRPPGPGAVHRRPHQRDPDHRPRRRHRPRQGLRGGRRRCAVLRRRAARGPSSMRSRPQPRCR